MNVPRHYVGALAEATFEQMLADLNRGMAWIEDLGIRFGVGSRFFQYRDLMTQLIRDHRDPDWRGDGPEHVQRYHSAAFEIADLSVIQRAFEGGADGTPGLVDRLRAIVVGPERIAQERRGNASNRARNVAFELVMAGRLAVAGFPVDLSARSDVRTIVEGHQVILECKRPMSAPAIRGNLATAMRQAHEGIANWPAGQASYIVALEASPAVNPGNRMLQALRPIDEAMEELSDGLAGALQRSLPRAWPMEMIGVIARFSGLIVDHARNIPVYTQQWATIWNNGTEAHRIAAAERLIDAMRAPDAMRRVVQR